MHCFEMQLTVLFNNWTQVHEASKWFVFQVTIKEHLSGQSTLEPLDCIFIFIFFTISLVPLPSAIQ